MSYGNLSSLIYSLFLIVSLWGVGILILRSLSFRFNGILEEGLFAIGIGYALITNILFFLGLFNFISYESVLAVFIMAVLLALYVLYSFFIKSKPFSYIIYRPNYYESLMIGLLLILFLTNIIGSLAPPTLGDSMNHHLSAPKYYGKIGGFPFIPISPWPAPGLMHVLYTQTMILSNGVVCQVISCLFGVATMLVVFALTRHYFGSVTGFISAIIFYSLPLTTELSTGAMVELGAAFCAVLGLWALLKAGPEFNTRWIVLAGFLGGCAGATKLWVLMGGPAAVVVIFVLAGRRFFDHPWYIFRALLVYSLAYGVILAPWFIRNYLASGNPLWPIGYSIFNTQYWSEISVLKYGNWTRGPGTSLWYYISGPWHLTNNIADYNAGYGIFTSYLLNPLILIFIPCTILYFKEFNIKVKRLLLALMVFTFTTYTIWFLGGYHHPRYIQMIHPLLCILAGAGMTTFLEKLNSFNKRIIAVLFTFISIFFLAVSLLINLKYFPVVFGYTSSEKYLEDNLPNFTGVQWLNKNLPENSKVLYAGTSAWYYMEKDYIPLALRSINYTNIRTPQGLAKELKEFGITHIYIESFDLVNAALRDYKLNSLNLCQEWLDLGAEGAEIDIITYHKRRPFVLMRGMELSGDLSLLSLIKTKLITSRIKGTSVESEVSVYAFE